MTHTTTDRSDTIFDVIGVGFGPANIALAIAISEVWPGAHICFLEREPTTVWQDHQLLRGADIQNNPLRDLVTPRNPKSHYSFTNYLYLHNKLLSHLNADFEFPLRREYAQYIAWAASDLEDICRYNSGVEQIEVNTEIGCFELHTKRESFYTRSVVLGSGRTPYVPDNVQLSVDPPILHASEYLKKLKSVHKHGPRVLVVGASQSAIEIVLDLHDRYADAYIYNVTPALGYSLKDTSPFTEEAFLPWFTDYYYDLDVSSKQTVDGLLRRSNYSAADADVIHELKKKLYEDELEGVERVRLLPFTYVTGTSIVGQRIIATVQDRNTGRSQAIECDSVIIATGYRDLGSKSHNESCPPLLRTLADHLATDDQGVLSVGRDYLVQAHDDALPGPIYLNGLCESTHGLGDAGSFSLLSLRSDLIAKSLGLKINLAV